MTGGAPLEKPAKRGPKARKPIRRSRIKNPGFTAWSKRVPKWYRKPIPRVSSSAARKAELAADRKWSKAVKRHGRCLARDFATSWRNKAGELCIYIHDKCEGRHEAAHGFKRDFLATRHDLANGFELCANAHRAFGRFPQAWERFMRSQLGDAKYEELRLKAHGQKV